MSGHWDRGASTDDEIATRFVNHKGIGGQGHDRIHGDALIPGMSSTIAMTGDRDDAGVDITARQKMLSAMSGSLLTSLLGKSPLSRTFLSRWVYSF